MYERDSGCPLLRLTYRCTHIVVFNLQGDSRTQSSGLITVYRAELADAKGLAQLSPAFSKMRRAHAQAIYVIEDGVFVAHRAAIVQLAANARLPAIFAQARVVEEGGLISYGPSWVDLYRDSAGYVDKILKGAKPSDVPVEQPNRYQLTVNLRIAHAPGITIPGSVLLRADEMIR